METIQVNVYSINELNDKAKQKAISDYNQDRDFQYIWNDAHSTVEAFCNQTGIKTGNRSWLEFNINNIEDSILELTGVRLMKYFINNFTFLYKPKYLKHFDSHKTHKMVRNKEGRQGKEYSMAYSNIQEVRDCNLTGVCYDESFLDPIYNFISNPNKQDTFQDIISECFESLRKDIESEIEDRQSDEATIEEIEANDYKFTQDGKVFRY